MILSLHSSRLQVACIRIKTLVQLSGAFGAGLKLEWRHALGRAEIAQTMHIYAMKMAGVFMITTSTISIQTRVFPQWMGGHRLRTGARAPAERRNHRMDSAGFSPVGAAD